MFSIKSEFTKYYSYQGRKVSKKISSLNFKNFVIGARRGSPLAVGYSKEEFLKLLQEKIYAELNSLN